MVAKELALTDSEHSDAEVSYMDNGTFNISRGQTPLTEGSEGKTPMSRILIWSFTGQQWHKQIFQAFISQMIVNILVFLQPFNRS